MPTTMPTTMKVMQIQDTWNPDSIRRAERPVPEPGPGEVLLRMEAASLNYRDYVMANGGYGRRGGKLPLVPCSDGAGRVVAAGPGVSRVAVGDLACPIYGQTWWSGPFREAHWAGTLGGPRDGVMQEYMALSQEGVVRAPRHLDAVQAATLAVRRRHRVECRRRPGPGEGRRRRARPGDGRRLLVRAPVREDARRPRDRHVVERRQARARPRDGRGPRRQLQGEPRLAQGRARGHERRGRRSRGRGGRHARRLGPRRADQRHAGPDRRAGRCHRPARPGCGGHAEHPAPGRHRREAAISSRTWRAPWSSTAPSLRSTRGSSRSTRSARRSRPCRRASTSARSAADSEWVAGRSGGLRHAP